MPTITETRVRNLNHLIDEYGSVKALAEAIGRAPSVVSQMKSGRFGEKIARHTERALGLPNGYLDTNTQDDTHSIDYLLSQIKEAYEAQSLSPEEKLLIASYRKIPKSKKKLVKDLINGLSEKIHNKAKHRDVFFVAPAAPQKIRACWRRNN